MRQRRRNILANAVGEGLWGFQWHAVLPSTTLTVLLTAHYAASNVEVGVLAGLEASAGLAQLLGLYLFYSRRHQKRHLFIWHYAVVIPLIVVTGGTWTRWGCRSTCVGGC